MAPLHRRSRRSPDLGQRPIGHDALPRRGLHAPKRGARTSSLNAMSKPILASLIVLGLAATLPATVAPMVRVANAETVDAAAITVRAGVAEPQKLSDLVAGRPTILHFWATWCAPCREELPKLDGFAAEIAARGLADRLLAISVDTKPHDRVAAFLHAVGVAHLPGWQVASGNAGSAFRLFGYPATLLIAPDGTVAERFAGPVDWDDPAEQERFKTFLLSE